MVKTADKPLTETFTQLDADRFTVEPGEFLLQMMRKDFNPANNDGIRPTIEHAEKLKNVRFSSGDWVALYTTSEQEETATLGYAHTHHTYVFTFDFFTSGDRQHLNRLVEEARRAFLASRKCTFDNVRDITGVSWMKWGIRSRAFDQNLKGFYRKAIDCQVRIRFRKVET